MDQPLSGNVPGSSHSGVSSGTLEEDESDEDPSNNENDDNILLKNKLNNPNETGTSSLLSSTLNKINELNDDDEIFPAHRSHLIKQKLTSKQLENFRQQWLKEISKKRQINKYEYQQHFSYKSTTTINDEHNNEDDDDNNKKECEINKETNLSPPSNDLLALARQLYSHGLQAERSGQLMLAVQCYRQATQLVPDIEFYCDTTTSESSQSTTTPSPSPSSTSRKPSPKPEETSTTDNTNFISKEFVASDQLRQEIQAVMVDYRYDEATIPTATESNEIRLANRPPNCHILALPNDILLYIFRWVIGTSLDVRQLDFLSQVCRRFYLLSRDPSLWRSICRYRWSSARLDDSPFVSWRHMAIYRPHVLFHGCYLSKASYVRQGEPTIGQVYDPYFLVEYYRAIRFMTDGTVYLLTSAADSPLAVVKQLSLISNSSASNTVGLLIGHYRVADDLISCVLRKAKTDEYQQHESSSVEFSRRNRRAHLARQQQQDIPDHTYHLELQIKNSKRYPNAKLHWYNYYLETAYRISGLVGVTNFDTEHNSQYPPFFFSRVKSYSANVCKQALPYL